MSERFNVILDSPPQDRWRTIVTRTDFKQVLKFFRVYALSDDEMCMEDKAQVIAFIFFGKQVPQVDNLFDHILDFIACGERDKDAQEEDVPEKPIFDYNVDHGRIFAAFRQAYGLDLRTEEMHWWVFCELLNNLPDNTKLKQVMDIRGRKIKKSDSAEYKRELRKIQNAVKIEFNTDGKQSGGKSAFDAAMDRW